MIDATSVHEPKSVIISQLLAAAAFLCSLASTISCDFVVNNLDYVGFTDVKKEVGFGMYCRHSPSLHHDKPALYPKYDFYHLFTEQMYFRISIICNTLASLLGLMLFWWALSLWCQYGNPLVMRTLTLMFIICAIFSAISHLLHFSRMCSIDVCNILPDLTDGSYCLQSYCTQGRGSIFSYAAICLWLCTSYSFELIRRKMMLKKYIYSSLRLNTGKKTKISVKSKSNRLRIAGLAAVENRESSICNRDSAHSYVSSYHLTGVPESLAGYIDQLEDEEMQIHSHHSLTLEILRDYEKKSSCHDRALDDDSWLSYSGHSVTESHTSSLIVSSTSNIEFLDHPLERDNCPVGELMISYEDEAVSLVSPDCSVQCSERVNNRLKKSISGEFLPCGDTIISDVIGYQDHHSVSPVEKIVDLNKSYGPRSSRDGYEESSTSFVEITPPPIPREDLSKDNKDGLQGPSSDSIVPCRSDDDIRDLDRRQAIVRNGHDKAVHSVVNTFRQVRAKIKFHFDKNLGDLREGLFMKEEPKHLISIQKCPAASKSAENRNANVIRHNSEITNKAETFEELPEVGKTFNDNDMMLNSTLKNPISQIHDGKKSIGISRSPWLGNAEKILKPNMLETRASEYSEMKDPSLICRSSWPSVGKKINKKMTEIEAPDN